jgi:hypothetical protein
VTSGDTALAVAVGFLLLGTMRAGGPGVRGSIARSSLPAAAIFAALAFALLAQALWRADLHVGFVARHLTTNLTPGWRLAAIWAEPAGAALVAAVLVLVSGWWTTRQLDAERSRGAVSAVGLVLIATSLVASPFAVTDFVPVEGIGLAAELTGVPGVAGWTAVTLGVVAGTIAVGRTVDGREGARAGRWTAICLLVGGLLLWEAGIRSGASRITSLHDFRDGLVAAAGLTVLLATLVIRGNPASPDARLCGALGSLASGLSLLLWKEGHLAGMILAIMGGALTLAALWLSRRPTAAALRRVVATPAPVLLLLAAGATLLAFLGEMRTRTTTRAIPGGGELALEKPLAVLTHVGVSRYEDIGSHVVAVALTLRAGSDETLTSPELRQFVTARDEDLGPPVSRPGIIWRPARGGRLVVWLEEALGGDEVRLEVRWIPMALLWAIGCFFCVVALLLPRSRPIERSCASCGRVVAGGLYCASCGATVSP